VKQVSEERSPAVPEDAWNEGVQGDSASDPTIANAGLTELQDRTVSATVDSSSFAAGAAAQLEEPVAAAPAQTLVNDAANPVAETNWESQTAAAEPAEVTPTEAAPTDQQSSWAEDTPTETAPTAGNDGFEQVVHHQRQNSVRNGRGNGRGRGRGDGSRGRGGRGEFRGRGRGRGDGKVGRGRGGFGGQQGNRSEAVATH